MTRHGFLIVLLLVGAAAQAADTITLYRPMGYSSEANEPPIPKLARLADAVQKTGMAVEIIATPPRRVMSRYLNEDGVCMLSSIGRSAPDELVSRRLFTIDFPFFVHENSGIENVGQVTRPGTLIGAEIYLNLADGPRFDWQLAPNYPVLETMLRSGRVDAITLGDAPILQGVPEQMKLRRLPGEAILKLDFAIYCKTTPQAAAFLKAVEREMLDEDAMVPEGAGPGRE